MSSDDVQALDDPVERDGKAPVADVLVRDPGHPGAPVEPGTPAAPADPGEPRFYPSTGNPVPQGARALSVETSDGLTLRAALFGATGTPHGTIVLLQGRNESIEKYFETAADLGRAGFVCVAFDWRGQGGSQRLLRDPMRGHVRSFERYGRDLDAVLDGLVATDCPEPVTLVGHSMGALVALLRAPVLPASVRRLVLLAPLLRLYGQPVGPRTMTVGLAALRALGMGRLYAAGGPRPREVPDFATNVLTTDPARHERNARIVLENFHLALGGPTVTWVYAALRAMARVASERHLKRVDIPTLVVAPGDDVVVSVRQMERLVAAMRNGNIVHVDGARHELLQERDRYRAQVLGAIEAFAARREPDDEGAEDEADGRTATDVGTS